MIPEFLLAMGLAFDPATGQPMDNDDPTAESHPDWSVLVPESRRPSLLPTLGAGTLPDLDEFASVVRYEAADTIAVLLLDILNPEAETTTVFAATYTPRGTICDILPLGTRGSETVTPFLDVRDNHGESVAFIARERPVEITFADAPETGCNITTVNITEVDVWNADNSDTETYRLTELHRTFAVEPGGHIRLTESRPVPTDRDTFNRRFNVTYP